MATYCSSGKSSGSGSSSAISTLQNLISSSSNHQDLDLDLDHDQLVVIELEQRKRKRMVSNRDSARRSRLRKQKHEDDLTIQVCQLNKEKKLLITEINRTTEKYSVFEAENWVLRAQVTELTHRLDSLLEIISFLNLSNGMQINYYSHVGYNYNIQAAHHHFFTDNNNNNNINIHAKATTTSTVDMLHY